MHDAGAVVDAPGGVLRLADGDRRAYRLWVDYSLASYLWATLAQIASDVRAT